jgi:hypothetical protein
MPAFSTSRLQGSEVAFELSGFSLSSESTTPGGNIFKPVRRDLNQKGREPHGGSSARVYVACVTAPVSACVRILFSALRGFHSRRGSVRRSGSASGPIICHMARLRRVRVDMLRKRTEFNLSAFRSSSMVIRSRKRRPNRSSFPMSVSPGSSFFRQQRGQGAWSVCAFRSNFPSGLAQVAAHQSASLRSVP